MANTFEDEVVQGRGPTFSYASEDGAPAVNQDSYKLIEVVGLANVIEIGARIRVELGSEVTMTQWPTVTPALAAWISTNPEDVQGGFEGKFPDVLEGLKVGQLVQIEIKMNAGADAQGIFPFLEPVVEG